MFSCLIIMLVIRIDLWEGRDDETKGKLIEDVATTVAEIINVDSDHITVLINDVPKSNWGVHGKQASKL